MNIATTSTTALSPAPVSVPAGTQNLSPEQLDIAMEVDTGINNILVMARAGTGKTFTIRKCLPLMRGDVCIAAYNRKISREIREKLAQDGVRLARFLDECGAGKQITQVGTFHALMSAEIKRRYPNVQIANAEKWAATRAMMAEMSDGNGGSMEIPDHLVSLVRALVDHAKERGFGVAGMASAKDRGAWDAIVSHFALHREIDQGHVAFQLATQKYGGKNAALQHMLKLACRLAYVALTIARKLATEATTIDGVTAERFLWDNNDQLWLPLLLNWKLQQYDWVCVDEAQDSNPVRREIARRMTKPGGRRMWVGDDWQAIYGFTGADNDSLDIIRRMDNPRVLPLTTTFRCGKAIVNLAKALVPDYKAHESNGEGEVLRIDEEAFAQMEMRPGIGAEGDAVICRNTKPLVSCAYSLIRRNIPVHIEGKEIGKKLISMTRRWRSIKSVTTLRRKLEEFFELEHAKLMKADQQKKADDLQDRVETLYVLIDSMPKNGTVDQLCERIEGLFRDVHENGEKVATVTLLTAHKSKGLEFDRVFGWGVASFMPSRFAEQNWEREQESHLIYVLWTRAIKTYVDVVVAA